MNESDMEQIGDIDDGLGPGEFWTLKLYVAGQSPRSLAAFANLKKICTEHLPDKYSIEVIDLLEHPQLAAGDQIIAIPTLIRKLPTPMRKIIGDLSEHGPGARRPRPPKGDDILIGMECEGDGRLRRATAGHGSDGDGARSSASPYGWRGRGDAGCDPARAGGRVPDRDPRWAIASTLSRAPSIRT